MIGLDEWDERSAILEYDQGMTRFAAETEAARRLGFKRYEAVNAKRERDTAGRRDHGSTVEWDDAGAVPGVQRPASEEGRPLLERDVPAGRDRLEMLALPISGGAVL